MSLKMNEDMREYLDIYLKEAEELIQSLNTSLLEFEKHPEKLEILNEVARCCHTLKGNSAAMGFTNIATLAHRLEDLLTKIKNNELKIDANLMDFIFLCVDALQRGIERVSRNEEEPDYSEIIDDIDSLLNAKRRGEASKIKNIKDSLKSLRGVELSEKPSEATLVKTVKVDIETLDKLVNLVGELLLIKMRLQNVNMKYRIKEFDSLIHKMEMLIEELQYEIMEARMVPVEQIFNRFPRMVRDIAKRENKKVEFIMEGTDIKLDRSVLDQLGEPLVHLLRNAVDHGIENPEERKKLGKPPIGTLKLIAKREKNSAIIEVIDDGRGFDLEEIKKVAIKRGLISQDYAKVMPENEILKLPFLPGFSTSKKVTEVSGRGVGLDVVKTKIESLNGTITLETKKNKGSRFIIRLPLSLAIVKCLLISLGKEKYALPIHNVDRIVKFDEKYVKYIENTEVFLLEDGEIPLIRLKEKFKLDEEKIIGKNNNNVVIILHRGNSKFGIVADDVIGEQDVMIKPLIKILRDVKGIAGATILGDGTAALVLDTLTLPLI